VKVIVNVAAYIKSIVADFPEEISGFRATPVANHLFDVRDLTAARALPEEQVHAFTTPPLSYSFSAPVRVATSSLSLRS